MATEIDGRGVVRAFVDAVAADSPADPTLARWVDDLEAVARLSRFRSGDVLIEHHAVAAHIHFLIEGTLRYEHLVTDESETISHEQVPWMPVGWSALHFRRYRATVVGQSDGALLTLPLAAWDQLATSSQSLHAHLAAFIRGTAAGLLWEARGSDMPAVAATTGSIGLQPAIAPDPDAGEIFERSAWLGSLPTPCREWLARHSVLYDMERGDRLLDEGSNGDGLWLLASGRVRLRFEVGSGDGRRTAVRHAIRPGSLLCWSNATRPLPAPHEVEATRSATVAHVPGSALVELLQNRPDWFAAVVERQLRQLRSDLLSSRSELGDTPADGGVDMLRRLVADGMPLHPSDTALNGLPDMFTNKLTRAQAFELLYRTHRHGTEGEREVAGLAIDLFQDFERGHRFTSGMRSAYDAVVRNRHLDPAELRKISTRQFREALSHVPYAISGLEHVPDDPNCVFIFNHMAYADDSILPNGFLYNPDSHLLSGVIVEPKYGDSVRIARTNARTEFWRADYYEPLGHVSVVTPESGRVDETSEEKEARKAKFWRDCERVLADGKPLCIAPEGTITPEDSITERSPGPLKPGAFLLSGRLPSRPRIVPVAMANFDKPAHTAVFACVVKPSFTMEERGVDVSDRAALSAFLEAYRKEFRGHVEEAIELARMVQNPRADRGGIVTNIDDIDPGRYEYEHDARVLQARTVDQPTGTAPTAFYGSSTIGKWVGLADDVGIPDALALGFGGATLEMARSYFHRLVVGHAPARLVVYCGENDIARGASAEVTAARFVEFAKTVRVWLPETSCWYISMKSGPALDDRRAEIEAANTRIAAEIEKLDQWQWLDWAPLMVDETGGANAALFTHDGVHVARAGYDVLAELVRGALAETS